MDSCPSNIFTCPDCNQNHPPFNFDCSTFQKYKIVNHIMAYCNVQINQFAAKRLAKVRNIISCDQVENNFKSSAYLAWNEEDFSGNESGSVRIGPLPPLGKSADRKKKTRRKFFRGSMSFTLDSTQSPSDGDMDTTMIPTNIVNSSQVNAASASNNSVNSIPPITNPWSNFSYFN